MMEGGVGINSNPEKPKEVVSFNGVVLERAEAGDKKFVPDQTSYMEDDFSRGLMQKIAISFRQGDPILLEGGTSLGKTKTVRHMAALLGWEVHYANLNGGTDVEDLMGRYIPNKDKKTADDPEYVFADGSITSGLRQEEGKTKIILLDEYNSIAPNIAIRVHEVLDALKDDGQVVLSEDASEIIRVSKENTKIIALTNPPGKGYIGREPLDPAQLRRWVYQKLQNELPEQTFRNFTRHLSGLEVAGEGRQESEALTGAKVVPLEEFKGIPGLEQILGKYQEFHKAAKALLGRRDIAQDQPQKFTFDDRMEPARVISYVRTFFRGDLTQAFQEGLRYYYANKLESTVDRQKLEELIKLVEYKPVSGTRRRSLEDTENQGEGDSKAKEALAASLQEILKQDPSLSDKVALALVNNRTQQAIDIRMGFANEGAVKNEVLARSLAGVSGQEGNFLRKGLLEEGASKNSILKGLMGCADTDSNRLRETLGNDRAVDKRALAVSLVGCNDHNSLTLRRKLLQIATLRDSVAESMAGIAEIDARRSYRELIALGVSPKSIVKGLKGIGGKDLHGLRSQFLREGKIEVEEFIASLIGVGDAESIEMRRAAISGDIQINNRILESLAGVIDDDGIRKTIVDSKKYSQDSLFKSLVGNLSPEADAWREGAKLSGPESLLKTYYLDSPVDNFIATRHL